MNPDVIIVCVVLLATIALFISERLKPDVIGLLIMASLGASGVLSPDKLFAGFGNQAVVTIAAMFVLSAALMRTGVVSALGASLTRLSKGNRQRFRTLSLGVVSVLSAFINNTPVVVVFIPAVLSVCRQIGASPSKFLMPIAFASILGGVCTLVGTSTNILVSLISRDLLGPGFELGMFEFGKVGLPLALVGGVYLYFFSDQLLPERVTLAVAAPAEAMKNYVTEVTVTGEELVGKQLSETVLGQKGVSVVELIRGEQIRPLDKKTRLRQSDVLLVRGQVNEILELARHDAVSVIPELSPEGDSSVRQVEMTLFELMIAPTSHAIGRTCRGIRLHAHYGVSAFAIQRNGQHIRRKIADIPLQLGDVLLVRGPMETIESIRGSEAFVVLEGIHEQIVEKRKAPIAMGVIAVVVLLAAVFGFPISVLAWCGVAVLLVTKVVTPRDAYRSIDWSILVMIAGTIALGSAMRDSGAAELIAQGALGAVHGLGPWAVLVVFYFLTNALTSFVSNNATAVLFIPLAISIAAGLGVDPKPFIMAVAFASSACFATPIGYQTNLLVYGPGGYFFKDFVRFGLPLGVIIGAVACLLIPFAWPF